jgi:hypothetical protein
MTNEYVDGDFADPAAVCDVIMKGGITSGVVYPLALTELAKRDLHQAAQRAAYRLQRPARLDRPQRRVGDVRVQELHRGTAAAAARRRSLCRAAIPLCGP